MDNNENKIKPFEFADLKSNHVISQNHFQPFEFKTLEGDSLKSVSMSDDEIRKERKFADNSNFKIDDVVRKSRGLTGQEQSELEQKIQEEVNRRLKVSYEEAYKKGFELGQEEGKKESLNKSEKVLADKIELFSGQVEDVKKQTQRLLEENKSEVYEFIKRFTKWIIIKEIDEKVYLENLLEKLILELNVKKNLIVKVGKANFSNMPEVIQLVENKVGQLTNVRIEIVPEINYPGIILESENGLIDGSLEGVFSNIDKIFSQVVGHERS
jgi:flagellar assembly protein FliH